MTPAADAVAKPARRRLAPEARKAEVLAVARAMVEESGPAAISVEQVARAAGISPPLLRHYFTDRDGLLVALAEDLTAQVLDAFGERSDADLAQRTRRYLEFLDRHRWAHRLWTVAAVEPGTPVGAVVHGARRRLMELFAGRPWAAMDAGQRVRAAGAVGLIESATTAWLEEGGSLEAHADLLVGALVRLQA